MSYDYNDNGPPANYRKRSGARLVRDKKGRDCLVFWRKNDRLGFVSGVAVPAKKGKKEGTIKSGPNKGQKWIRFVASLEFRDRGETKVTSGFYNPETGKMRLPDFRWTVSTKARNGGYFGPGRKPKN